MGQVDAAQWLRCRDGETVTGPARSGRWCRAQSSPRVARDDPERTPGSVPSRPGAGSELPGNRAWWRRPGTGGEESTSPFTGPCRCRPGDGGAESSQALACIQFCQYLPSTCNPRFQGQETRHGDGQSLDFLLIETLQKVDGQFSMNLAKP